MDVKSIQEKKAREEKALQQLSEKHDELAGAIETIRKQILMVRGAISAYEDIIEGDKAETETTPPTNND